MVHKKIASGIKKVYKAGRNKKKTTSFTGAGRPVFSPSEAKGTTGGIVVSQKKGQNIFEGGGVKKGDVRNISSGGGTQKRPDPIFSQAQGSGGNETQSTQTDERGGLDIAKDLLFGNYLEKNPITGEVKNDPNTGEPIKVRGGTLPIGAWGLTKGTKAALDLAKSKKAAQGVELANQQISSIIKAMERQSNANTAKNLLANPKLAKIFRDTGNIPLNAKTIALKTSYLKRLASAAKDPRAVLGLLGTLLFTSIWWAPNEQGDAATTLTFAAGDYADIGDVENAERINELLKETGEINPYIPATGFMEVETKKLTNLLEAGEAAVAKAKFVEAKRLKEENEPTFAEEREIQRGLDREAGKARSEDFNKARNDQLDKERERELEERAENSAFFDNIRKENAEREATKPLTESAKSNLGFGIISSSGSVLTKKKKKKEKEGGN